MRVRMFKPEFALKVRSGSKRQTIRPVPKRLPKVGDFESWRQWSGKPYRSKQIELALVQITEVKPITITKRCRVELDGRDLSSLAVVHLAHGDGFNEGRDLLDWFIIEHGLPFSGILIRAKDA